jgi:hypothetical protein
MLNEALGDQMFIICMVCAVVSLIIELLLASGEERSKAWIDGVAIRAAVSIVSMVQEMQFAAFNRIKSIFDAGVI